MIAKLLVKDENEPQASQLHHACARQNRPAVADG